MTPGTPEFRLALGEFASLLDYPGDGAIPAIPTLAGLPVAASGLEPFLRTLRVLDPGAREELHTATFDINPAAVPYVGIHLFGEENFKRGEFMAALRHQYESAAFDPGWELPDHLATLLRYLPASAAEEREEFVSHCLLGPVARMRDALAADNPYRHLLEALHAFLVYAFPGARAVPAPRDARAGFTSPCATFASSCQCPPADPLADPMEPSQTATLTATLP
jgi:nitrate reductase delta subunit